MKTKIAFYSTFALMLATLMTGCCTQSLLEGTKQVTLNSFNPSAVYQTTNGIGLGLEGVSRKHFDYQAGYYWHTQPGIHTYLIIPGERLAFQHQQMDENSLMGKIQKLSPDSTKDLKPKSKLPSDYVKVADLPKNDIYLDLAPTRPGPVVRSVAIVAFIPFTFAIDVVTFPIQLPILLAMRNGHT